MTTPSLKNGECYAEAPCRISTARRGGLRGETREAEAGRNFFNFLKRCAASDDRHAAATSRPCSLDPMSSAILVAKRGADMTVDDILLKALANGPATVEDILKHFESRVRIRLEKLRVRGVVGREGRGGPHRQFTYRMLRPDLAAKALSEKGGGLSRAAKMTPKRR